MRRGPRLHWGALSLALIACDKPAADIADSAPPEADASCDALDDSVGRWAVQVHLAENDCGLPEATWEATYGMTYTGAGMAIRSCEGLDAEGWIGGCAWTYDGEVTARGGLPDGGRWSLEAEGYAWVEAVDYCELPEGLDWSTVEVVQLIDAGETGLEEGCECDLEVTGVLTEG